MLAVVCRFNCIPKKEMTCQDKKAADKTLSLNFSLLCTNEMIFKNNVLISRLNIVAFQGKPCRHMFSKTPDSN